MSPSPNRPKPTEANIKLRVRRYRVPVTTLRNRRIYISPTPRPSAFNFPNPAPHRTNNSGVRQRDAPVQANMGIRISQYRAPPRPARNVQHSQRSIDNDYVDDDTLLERMRRMGRRLQRVNTRTGVNAREGQRPSRAVGEADEQVGNGEYDDMDDDEDEEDDDEMMEEDEDDEEEDEYDEEDDEEDDNDTSDETDSKIHDTPAASTTTTTTINDSDTSTSASPALGLRGGDAPGYLRADLELMAKWKLQQQLDLFPINDEDDEGPSLAELRAMYEQMAEWESEAEDGETDEEVEALRRRFEREVDEEDGVDGGEMEDDGDGEDEEVGEVEALGPDDGSQAVLDGTDEGDTIAFDDGELGVGEEPDDCTGG
ncbi:MAG: hypothetical protein Q9225_000334 [Loekoesia sp. 1 TL-2023]